MSNQKRGNVKSLTIFSSKDPGRDVDLRAGVVEMNYYENILSPAITADIAISETNQSIPLLYLQDAIAILECETQLCIGMESARQALEY